MKAVANSTPLIYFAKANALQLLSRLYEEVVIPQAVYEEVVVKGLKKGYKDAGLVKAAIKEGSIRVEKAHSKNIEKILKQAPMLHRGEAEVLALALHYRPCHVLLDDRAARLVARALGLEAHGTLYIVITAAAKGAITVKEALKALDKLVTSGFRISIELYLKTREKLLKEIGTKGKQR